VSESPEIESAADNDVIFKAACYGLTGAFWPDTARLHRIGVLGSARYVLARAVDRKQLTRAKEQVHAEATAFLRAVTALEPTASELKLAAEMEAIAQQEALSLDTGESQLAAMTIEREIGALETGDKRAAQALEELLDHLNALAPLAGKVRCLEQLVLRLISEVDVEVVTTAVCAEPLVDRALSNCFGCHSEASISSEMAVEGLTSYIEDARRYASRILAA
jgi:hypothetical protein